MEELLEALDVENPADVKQIPKEIEGLWKRNGKLYLKYIQIFRRLEEVHDQIAHPQKRLAIKSTLEAIAGRILELREILCKLHKTNYPKIEEFLVELQILPETVEIPVPRFAREMSKASVERKDSQIVSFLPRSFRFSLPDLIS